MDRKQLLALWNEMWAEGNWIPSWPASLAGLNAEQAAWMPDTSRSPSLCHSIWQEVAHVTFWRHATLKQMAGEESPTPDEIAAGDFLQPLPADEPAWAAAQEALKETQDKIAVALSSETTDSSRIPFHLIHDGYHLGRITQLRALQGTAPPF